MKAASAKNKELLGYFNKLKALLSRYEPPLIAKSDYEARYELQFDKDYETRSERTGKVTRKHGLDFAAIIIQSNYVGLYFMPIYAYPRELAISERLKKMLKGKSCFYVKEWDEELEEELTAMIDKGYQLFDKM